jgi:hypothetical protein
MLYNTRNSKLGVNLTSTWSKNVHLSVGGTRKELLSVRYLKTALNISSAETSRATLPHCQLHISGSRNETLFRRFLSQNFACVYFFHRSVASVLPSHYALFNNVSNVGRRFKQRRPHYVIIRVLFHLLGILLSTDLHSNAVNLWSSPDVRLYFITLHSRHRAS